MKKLLFLYLMLMYSLSIMSQTRISIDECYSKAQANYPLIKQYDLIDKLKDYNISNAAKSYLPQIIFSTKATYQSEVTEIPISIPEVKDMSKDQYSATIELNQIIWDGGEVRAHKRGIAASSEAEIKSVETTLYALNDRVNHLFFGILLIDAQIDQNRLYSAELKSNYDKVTSYVRNGIANKSDLDAIRVEQLKAEQSKTQLIHTRRGFLDILSTLIGERLDHSVELIKPEFITPLKSTINRPELELYDAKIRSLEIKTKQINAGLMPKIGLFATGGYGRPGLNMLDNDFEAFYIAGVQLSWRLGGLYTNKNSKRLIETEIGSVMTQRETFLFNTNMDISQKESDIDKYREMLNYDDEIIELRNAIKRSSESKMANGTLSGIDLIRDINAEDLAKQDKILHEIELLQALYNLKFVINN